MPSLLALTLLGAVPALAPPSAERRALLVAVEAYPAESGWPRLAGPRRDAEEVARILTERGGFAPDAIVSLIDERATRSGILSAWEGLVETAAPGDLLLFFFAGHGSRVPDLDGDEADGWDETLVPYDAQAPDGSVRDLLDDDLARMIARANEVTPNVVIVLDCCSSGSATRGGEGTVRFVDPAVRGLGGARLSRAASGAREEGSGYFARDLSYVALSACRANESAFEAQVPRGDGIAGAATERRGVFTVALVEALRSPAPAPTYRALLEAVRGRVRTLSPAQTPVIEGPLADAPPLGGDAPLGLPLVREGRRWIVLGGTALGLFSGAELEALGPDGAPRGRLVVVSADPQRAVVRWRDPSPEVGGPWRARLVSFGGAGAAPLAVALEPEAREAAPTWEGLLGGDETLRLVPDPAEAEVLLSFASGRWGARVGGVPVPALAEADPERLARRIAHLAEARRLSAELAAAPPARGVAATLVRLDEAARPVEPIAPLAEGGYAVRRGEALGLTVENLRDEPLHANLLAIGPDGAVELVTPYAPDDVLPPGARATPYRWRAEVDEASAPLYRTGRERFVLVVSARPLDLSLLRRPAAVAPGLAPRRGLAGVREAAAGLPFEVLAFDLQVR